MSFITLSLYGLLLLPDWASSLKPEADVLLQYREARESGKDISGLELGLRAGVFPELQPWLELGLEFRAAESEFGARPDIIELSGSFSNKALGLSQAYLAFQLKEEDDYELTLSLGKFYNPFFSSPLTWDYDYRPEGAYQSFWIHRKKWRSRFQVHAGQWSLDRVGQNLTNAQSLRRSYLFVQGFEWQFLYSRYTKIRSAIQSYYYCDVSERSAELAVRRGNDGQIEPGALREDFLPLEASLQFESQPLGLSLLLESSFAINFMSEENDRGFMIAGQVGREWRERNFVGRLSFLYSEPNVQLASVLDNEWGYTNIRGGKARIGFFPVDQLELSVEGSWIERLQESLYQGRLTQVLAGVKYQFL